MKAHFFGFLVNISFFRSYILYLTGKGSSVSAKLKRVGARARSEARSDRHPLLLLPKFLSWRCLNKAPIYCNCSIPHHPLFSATNGRSHCFGSLLREGLTRSELIKRVGFGSTKEFENALNILSLEDTAYLEELSGWLLRPIEEGSSRTRFFPSD